MEKYLGSCIFNINDDVIDYIPVVNKLEIKTDKNKNLEEKI